MVHKCFDTMIIWLPPKEGMMSTFMAGSEIQPAYHTYLTAWIKTCGKSKTEVLLTSHLNLSTSYIFWFDVPEKVQSSILFTHNLWNPSQDHMNFAKDGLRGNKM